MVSGQLSVVSRQWSVEKTVSGVEAILNLEFGILNLELPSPFPALPAASCFPGSAFPLVTRHSSLVTALPSLVCCKNGVRAILNCELKKCSGQRPWARRAKQVLHPQFTIHHSLFIILLLTLLLNPDS